MRNQLTTKLKNRNGASLMLALLVFLICALCGLVVLAAGSAAAGRISGIKESSQNQYSLTSAAQVFQDELNDAQYTYSAEENTKGSVTPAGGVLNNVLVYLCDSVSNNQKTATTTAQLTVTNEESGLLNAKVNIEITMKTDYSITAVFQLDGNTYNKVTLTADGVPYDKKVQDTDIPLSVTWANPVIAVGDGE